MLVRAAVPEDAGSIRSIYAHHLRHGVGTFEEGPPDLAEMVSRLRREYWLVAEVDHRLLGYACYGPYRDRSGYRFTVEDSVYVRPDATGGGIGSRLLAGLIEHARAAGYRQMVAAVGSSDNLASIALHRRHGFERVGVLPAVGHKLGRTLDVVLLQRALHPAAVAPGTPGGVSAPPPAVEHRGHDPVDEVDRGLERAILALLDGRADAATLCPSEAARAVGGQDWRPLMDRARQAAGRLRAADLVEITQRGRPVDPATARGPIRIRRPR